MARTIAEIFTQIESEVAATPALSAQLTSTSKVAVWRMTAWVYAAVLWTLEKLFDAHRAEVDAQIAAQKPHTARWYVTKALGFQYGSSLVADADYYDNTGLTAAQVAAQKVVKYAAAIEIPKGLRIKVARLANGDLAPLTVQQLASFEGYLQRVKDAGVKVYADSNPADALKLDVKIYYDPLVLDAQGQRLDGTDNTPVQKAITNFLKDGMPFNGLFVRERLVDALQAVPGVVFPEILTIQARYGALAWQAVGASYLPDAGWLRIAPADLNLQFQPHEPL